MITGTFLDEISHDIASANWGPEEWRRDFAAMKADGIDTVILTRAGLGDRAALDTPTLRALHPRLIAHDDLVSMFLGLAEEHDMAFWLGTYDSGRFCREGGHAREIDLNRRLADEVWERYGRSAAFRGWYVAQPLSGFDEGALQLCEQLGAHLRQLSGLPILVSAALRGSASDREPFSAERHRGEWGRVLARLAGAVDVVAFQDGSVACADLPELLAVNAELARQHGLALWSCVESFDRDVHVKYPPIAWPKLRTKVECAQAAGAAKLVTFEYSHFLSPHSVFPAAHTLHRRYREWLAKRG